MKYLFFLLACTIILYTAVSANTIFVKNLTELNAADKNATPGDIIILQNGIWDNSKIELTCSGTTSLPIIFKAATNGQIIIKGKSSLRISGKFIIVEGLVFTEGAAPEGSVWEFKAGNQVANNCRITNCMIRGFNNPNRMKENYWIAMYGKNNRIDHCNFLDKTNLGVLLAVVLTDDKSRMNNHSIDSNYFGIRKPLGSNGGEVIRVGVSEHCTFYRNTSIRNNLFEYCDGETEIISIKSCGNSIRGNVFKECQGAVVLRHGNNNTVEGNFFLGNGKEGTGGVRVINEGNWIVNNFFSNCKGEGFRSPLAVMNGVFNSPANRYLPVRDAVIANNTFLNCTPFSLGEGSDIERSVAPKNVYLFNNLFYSDKASVLCYIYDKTDSIFFSGNIFNGAVQQPALPGFDKRNITLQQIAVTAFPVYSISNGNKLLSDSLQQLSNIRLQKDFPTSPGCGDLKYFKALYDQSIKMGIQWKETPVKTISAKAKTVQCNDAASLYNYLNSSAAESIVQLTGKEYVFDKPLIINKNTSIRGTDASITFKSINILSTLFEIKGNSMLKLENLKINADPLQLNHFIAADTSGTCIHYKLYINNCRLTGLNAISFFTANKYSYADEIKVSNTTFSSNTGSTFSLKEELDNRGYYNVEKMVIENCLFENHKGSLLNIYRGGNDESTMGPKLFFIKNKIKSCNNEGELIKLFGVQQSSFSNNSFTGSNQNKAVLIYADNVRAVHLQKNNTFINSGTITENKFVKNIY